MRTLEVKQNVSKRTFTIRSIYNGKLDAKYRTLPFSKDEFYDAQYWSENDWFDFLKTDEYYIV